MRYNLLIILIVFTSILACKHELFVSTTLPEQDSCELQPNETLSDIIPGTWLGDAHKGFPHFDTLWHEVDGGTIAIEPSGNFVWGNLQGFWTADDTAHTIEFDFDQVNYINTTLNLSEFDRCIFVTEHLTDEGFTYNRFRKQ